MSCKIVMVCGGKVGTGKSCFLRYVISWLHDAGVFPLLLDADDENSTMSRFFDTIKIVPSRERAYDVIVDIAEKGERPLVIWDLKAGTGNLMEQWIANVPFQELQEIGVTIVLVILITSSPDSTSAALRWVNFLGKRVKYLVVRNLKDSDSHGQKPEEVVLPGYDDTRQAAEFRRLYRPTTLVMPGLDPEFQSELERLNLTIRDILARHPKTPPALSSLIVRSRLRNYQARLYEAFDVNKELLLP